MPMNKLLNLPYGSYLMVRLDYKIICGDELEAKIMRIIEMYMDDERRAIYKQLLNDPQNTLDKDAEVDVTKDVWAAISHRLFKNDLYDQDMSENTLKRALKSLRKKKFILVRDQGLTRYEAPKYQINTEIVQAELSLLGKIGKTEYQKLMVSKIDGIKNSSHQKETPSDHQNLTGSSNSRVSKFDGNSRRDTDTVEDTEEEGTYSAHAQPPARTLEETPYVPDYSLTSHSQPSPEDHADDNHHHGATHRSPAPAASHRVAAGDPAEHSGAHAQAPGAPASDGADQGHAGATGRAAGVVHSQGASAGGSGYEKPAGTGRGKSGRTNKAPAQDEPTFTEEGQKVYDAWASLFKSPPPVGPQTIKCANELYARLMPWCQDLHLSCKLLLKEIKGWLYATDPDWYRSKGVALCDINTKFERWQSAKTEEQERSKPVPAPAREMSTVERLRAEQNFYLQRGGMQA